MSGDLADRALADLPRTIPVFPLSGVLLLPGGRLPLNIFEPRYLKMTHDALAGPRMIGMVQPLVGERQVPEDHPDLYRIGCAGRITANEEESDGRITLVLTGLCRFDIVDELPLLRGYRRVTADYAPYRDDLAETPAAALDRDRLLGAVRRYFDGQGIAADWAAIERTPDERLVNALAMICPFAPAEKQALLECDGLRERCEVVTTLMEMAAAGGDGPRPAH